MVNVRSSQSLKKFLIAFFSFLFVVLVVLVYFFLIKQPGSTQRSSRVMEWIRYPEKNPDWAIQAGDRCENAPFSMPTSGYIGFLWDDSFRPGHHHTGLDIFGGSDVGITPIYAAYDGYFNPSIRLEIDGDYSHPARPSATSAPNLDLLHPHG